MTKKIVVSLLVILEIISIFLVYKTRPVEDIVLDDVKLKEEDASNNGFALMIETENADGTTSYVESNSNTWPTGMKFNSENSGCVDVNNNIIENALEYDSINNIMNVSVSGTAYCYVYFDLDKSLASYIKNNPPAEFNTALKGGLYRYQGTDEVVTNNYVCFGTTDKDTCVSNEDTYMYRIIGIDENNQLKLIKEKSIGSYMWHSDRYTNTSWSESDLYKGLNGIEGGYYTNLFVNNNSYDYMEQNSNWYNKIANYDWKYGDLNIDVLNSYDGSFYYRIKSDWTDAINAKIGLMYMVLV